MSLFMKQLPKFVFDCFTCFIYILNILFWLQLIQSASWAVICWGWFNLDSCMQQGLDSVIHNGHFQFWDSVKLGASNTPPFQFRTICCTSSQNNRTANNVHHILHIVLQSNMWSHFLTIFSKDCNFPIQTQWDILHNHYIASCPWATFFDSFSQKW